MDKNKFLEQLKKRLSFLPEDELERTIAYYSEIISDRTDTGMSEEDAVAAVGNIDEIVESVRADGNYPYTTAPDKEPNGFAKVMLWIGIIASYFVLVWDIIFAIGTITVAVTCLIIAFTTGISLGMPAFSIFIGITLMLLALFLITIPISSYLRFGIRRMKEILRR